LAQIIFGGIGFKFVQMKGIALLQGEIIANVLKYTDFLISFSRTSQRNSFKLGTNYVWVKGIQFCTNKGPGPLQRRDNRKNVKMGWGHLKIFFSRTTVPISTIHGGRGFKFAQTKGIAPL
jgi:hypothetical protein